MLQPPRLKYHMKTIGIDQSLIISALFEQICLQRIKKSYKHARKCEDQQQFKDVLEASMVSTIEVLTNNRPKYPCTPTTLNKPSARKSLYIFTNILDVKKKTAIRQVGAAKSKRKTIKAGTTLWSLDQSKTEIQ